MHVAFKVLQPAVDSSFPAKGIYMPSVPTKSTFFCVGSNLGESAYVGQDSKRGWQLPKRCYLCGYAEESVLHILLHCPVVSPLWEIFFVLIGVRWVFPKTIKEALLSWRCPFVGRKRKQIWYPISLCIYWTLWKERNCIAFKEGKLFA